MSQLYESADPEQLLYVTDPPHWLKIVSSNLTVLPDGCQYSRIVSPGQPVQDGEDSSLRGHEDTRQALLLFKVVGLNSQTISKYGNWQF